MTENSICKNLDYQTVFLFQYIKILHLLHWTYDYNHNFVNMSSRQFPWMILNNISFFLRTVFLPIKSWNQELNSSIHRYNFNLKNIILRYSKKIIIKILYYKNGCGKINEKFGNSSMMTFLARPYLLFFADLGDNG